MSEVEDLGGAVYHLIQLAGDVEMIVGGQLGKLDEIEELMTVFEGTSSDHPTQMSMALLQARTHINHVVRSMNSFIEHGEAYENRL